MFATTLIRNTATLGLATSLLACAQLPAPVQAWEKGQLARPDMAFEGDGLDQRFVQHVYASKEGTSGGSGVGGGGCGCN